MESFTDMLGTAADSAGPSTPSVGATDSREGTVAELSEIRPIPSFLHSMVTDGFL